MTDIIQVRHKGMTDRYGCVTPARSARVVERSREERLLPDRKDGEDILAVQTQSVKRGSIPTTPGSESAPPLTPRSLCAGGCSASHQTGGLISTSELLFGLFRIDKRKANWLGNFIDGRFCR